MLLISKIMENKLIIYRIKHKLTGLFFTPVRQIKCKIEGVDKYVKSNLSIKGKIYLDKKPKLSNLTKILNTHVYFNGVYKSKCNGFYFDFNENDWEIEETAFIQGD